MTFQCRKTEIVFPCQMYSTNLFYVQLCEIIFTVYLNFYAKYLILSCFQQSVNKFFMSLKYQHFFFFKVLTYLFMLLTYKRTKCFFTFLK